MPTDESPHAFSKTGAACLYINTLEDVDQDVLRELVTLRHRYMVTENFT